MFDVGFWEIALIGIVTLLVVGPDRLPEVASTAGRWVLKMRRFVAGVKADFNRELETGDLHKILGDQKQQINELRSMVDSTRRDFESSTKDAVSAAKKQFDSVEELGKGAVSSAVGNSTFPKSDPAGETESSGASTQTPANENSATASANTSPAPPADAPTGAEEQSNSGDVAAAKPASDNPPSA